MSAATLRVREGDHAVLVPESGGGRAEVVQVTRNGCVAAAPPLRGRSRAGAPR